MAILDTIDVIATDVYKRIVLQTVFRVIGAGDISTTEMQLRVITTGAPIDRNVNFRRGTSSMYIHGYDIAIEAGTTVTGFEFREIGKTDLTAAVSLTSAEQKHFDEAGILYIDEIRFNLNVSLG